MTDVENWGHDIVTVARRIVNEYKTTGKPVESDFNGIILVADAEHNVSDIVVKDFYLKLMR